MIYVWAAPRAAASDRLAQELRCSPIMIYMRSSPSPGPRGPPCAPALPQCCQQSPACVCRPKPGSAKPSPAKPSRALLAGSHRDTGAPPGLPLSPGSVTIHWAPDERGHRSIFSSVQKGPIYLGAPVLSRLGGRVGSVCHHGRVKQKLCGDTGTHRKLDFQRKISFWRPRSQNVKVAAVLGGRAQRRENPDVVGEGWLRWQWGGGSYSRRKQQCRASSGFCFISCVNQVGGSPPGRGRDTKQLRLSLLLKSCLQKGLTASLKHLN